MLSLIGLFLTLWFTLRADRRREERHRAAEARRATEERIRQYTTELVVALSPQVNGRISHDRFRKWSEGKFDAMLRFSLLVLGPHPHVSGWVLAQAHFLNDAMEKWEVEAEAGGEGSAHVTEVLGIVGKCLGAVMRWSAGKRDDAWFEGRDHHYEDEQPD